MDTLSLEVFNVVPSAKLVIPDKSLLVEMGNGASIYRNVVVYYIRLLLEGE